MVSPTPAPQETSSPPTPTATCGQRIVAALPLLWTKWVALYDASGRLHWRTGEEQGLGEHEAVRVALENFVGRAAPARVNHPLPHGRAAVLLRAADETGAFRGFVMVVIQHRWLRGKGPAAPDLPVPVMRAVREWGATLAGQAGPEMSTQTSATLLDSQEVIALLEPLPTPEITNPPLLARLQQFAERLEKFAFTLYAQPLSPIQIGTRVKRYEVLMRATGAEPTESAPESLIQGAAAAGLSAMLDRRVISELLPWLRARSTVWTGEPTQFSMNVAAQSLRDPLFVGFLVEQLERSGLPRGLIAVEIEYPFCQRNFAFVEHLATHLERAGGGLVIDDFTVGESSPEMLLLPGLRLIKIDPHVTGAVPQSRAAQGRVAACVQMARIAGVHVVAKRVEVEAHQSQLQALGVDFVQGFASAPPAALDNFDAAREQRMLIDPELGEGGSEGLVKYLSGQDSEAPVETLTVGSRPGKVQFRKGAF
jgi:EAL domain-containing protein (putative c-di-GMP-specific phosphodiesterase class I)